MNDLFRKICGKVIKDVVGDKHILTEDDKKILKIKLFGELQEAMDEDPRDFSEIQDKIEITISNRDRKISINFKVGENA